MATFVGTTKSDGSPLEWSTTGSNHWDEVNKTGASPDTGTYISCGNYEVNSFTDEMGLTNPTDVDSCTKIKIELFGESETIGWNPGVEAIAVDLYVAGAYVGSQELTDFPVYSQSPAWCGYEWSGTWSQANVNTVKVKINTFALTGISPTYVYGVRVTYTYTQVSTSVKKVSGVANADIKKISGVARASVKKVSGVA